MKRHSQVLGIVGRLAVLALALMATPAAFAFAITPAMTGAWYDPQQSGHGLFLEVLPQNQLLAFWFTFSPDGTQQSWFGGVGSYAGNVATVSVALTTGGRWIPDFDASKVVNHPWGTLTFAFTGCNSGRVDFTSTYPGYGSNHMDLTRLTMPAGLTCTSTANVSALKGLWTGSTSLDESVVAVVIEDGTYEIVYSKPATSGDAGVIRGTSSADGGKFSSSDARNFPVAQAQEATGFSSIAAVDGTFVPGSQLHLTMTTRTATRTLAATYVAGSDQPPSLAVPAGAYTGFTGHVGGRQEAAYTIDAAGHIAGVNAATCTFSGTITPRASVRVFDWTLVATNDHCIFGTGPLSGIAYYDDASRQIHAFATFSADGAPDQYFMIGTKN